MTKKTSNRFSPEAQQRAVRVVLEHGGDHASQWAAIGKTVCPSRHEVARPTLRE